MGQSIFSGMRFTELLKFDPQEAFEYRLRTQGTPIEEFYGTIPMNTRLNENIRNGKFYSDEEIAEMEEPKEEEEKISPIIPTSDENSPQDIEVVIGNTTEISGDITNGGEVTKTSYSRDDFKKLLDKASVTYFK